MENSTLVRRIEPFFLVGIATFYVTDRLITEVSRLDDMATRAEKIPGATTSYWIDPASYHYVLNNNLPLITGVVFFLSALFVFHYKAYPLLNQESKDKQAWLFVGLTVILLVSSAFFYYYFKQYVRFRHDSLENIIGLKAYSIYRKKTVLASALGLGLLVFAYELLFQSYVYLIQKITSDLSDLKDSVRVIGYLLVGGLYFLLLAYSFFTLFPRASWLPPLNNGSFLLALISIIYLLQSYCFRYILPELRNFPSSVVGIHVLVYVIIGLVSTITLFKLSNQFYVGDILAFLFISYVASFSVAYLRRVMSREKTALQTQVSTKSAELASLRAQINPHFLFNALNSLYATALKENSEKTADGIQKLGDMMRFMLQENNRERIPLSKEIEYLHNYIQLQRMRLDESHGIEIRVTIQEPERDIYLAPMMLIPFVENAFKHGISLRKPSWIYVTLTLDATRLYFKVHNSLHARHANDPEEDKSGVGLNNVQKRLELIYPGRHELTIQQSDQDYFVALTLGFW